MSQDGQNNKQMVIREQRVITDCAVEIIRSIHRRRGKPLQPRDRMALKLLTPKNSALLLRNGTKTLGCRQINFEILTDDLGLGAHRLTPTGVHVYNPDKGWWSDHYGLGEFLWNLRLKEDPKEGMARILDHLFKFKMKSLFGATADFQLKERFKTIAANVDRGLKLYVEREDGAVETTLRRMVRAKAMYSPKDLGLPVPDDGLGRTVLIFGKNQHYGISFSIEKI